MSSNRDEYERSAELYNAGDLEGFAGTYTEDAVLVTPDGTFQGRAAIREYWSRNIMAPYPEGKVTLDVIVEQGNTIAGEFTFAGTNTGPLVMPDGTELPPTGKRVEIKGMELLQIRDGKAAVHHMYWDNMASAGQLGLLPEDATA